MRIALQFSIIRIVVASHDRAALHVLLLKRCKSVHFSLFFFAFQLCSKTALRTSKQDTRTSLEIEIDIAH
jgi:hypothetical protein